MVVKKEDYCNKDGVYAENEHFVLRRLCEQEKENFMELKSRNVCLAWGWS